MVVVLSGRAHRTVIDVAGVYTARQGSREEDRHVATTLESIRETARWTSGINLVAGLWLISAPFVLGYAYVTNNALWNDIIVGIVVTAIAAVRVAEPLRHASVSWINAALGAWRRSC